MSLLTSGPKKLGLEGPAGAGKTLVLLLEIMSIWEEGSKYNVILLVPDPYQVQCRNFLEDNGVDVRMNVRNIPVTTVGYY